jgi:hypothetical protein
MHDRTTIAWLVLGCYLAGAVAALWAGRLSAGADRRFWFGTAVLVIVLGLAKRFKLQDWLIGVGRSIAKLDGLYEHRRLGQSLFVLALAVIAALAVASLRHWFARSPLLVKTAAVAVVLLLSFVVVRAISIHAMDEWVTAEVGGVRAGWWLELAGIAAIALSAVIFARARASQQSR